MKTRVPRVQHRGLALAVDQLARCLVGPGNEMVSGERPGIIGHAMRGEIGRRGAEHPGIIGQLAALQTAIAERRAAQGEIETALDQVMARIRQPQIQRQIRVARLKIRQQRHHVQLRKTARRGKTQRAGNPAAAMSERGPGGALLGQDFAGIGQEVRALERERDLARRPVQQFGPECLFQPRAGNRGGEAERAPRTADIEPLGRHHEQAQAVGVQMIISQNGKLKSKLAGFI